MKRGCSGVFKTGTAREAADHGQGYSANGESQFSRQSASAPEPHEPTSLQAVRRRDRGVDEVSFQQGEAARIRNNIRKHADNPEKVAALKDVLAKKLLFIERLRAER